jgi:enterochelin esterase-like enzyme
VFRHTGFTSRFLQGERDVSVYVPLGYEEQTERQYPLLILQDGQNLFDPETSFIRGKTWRVAESADDAIDAGEVEPLVIAGVANAGERRLAEYTPSRDMKLGGGDGGQYALMVTRELLPCARTTGCDRDPLTRVLADRRWALWCRCGSGCDMRIFSASWRCCRRRCGGITATSSRI